MKAVIRLWDQNGSLDETKTVGYKYHFDTGSQLSITPSFAVAMLRALADDIEKEYGLKSRPTATHRGVGADGGIH